MPAYICTTCGTQYPEADNRPAECTICQEPRQYVNPLGQAWTTLPAMRRTHFNGFRQHEPGLLGIGTMPGFAIGQRALLLRTAAGNILWDCISFIDDATVEIVRVTGRYQCDRDFSPALLRVDGRVESRLRRCTDSSARRGQKVGDAT